MTADPRLQHAADCGLRGGQDACTCSPADLFTEDPLPLVPTYCPVPFPTPALPPWGRAMVEAEAEATQTDPGMAGAVFLGVLAAAAGGHAQVSVRPGWSEPVNLFTVAIAEPGTRKSAVFGALTEPLGDAEKQLTARDATERWETDVHLKVALQTADRLQREAANARATKADNADDKLSEAMTARAAAEAFSVPVEPRLLADDATPEALVSLLADQGGRIAVFSAEGGVFDMLAGRYSRAPNLDPILKGHAGDRIRVDRKGRPTEYIDRPALTMCLTVQPRVIEEIGRTPVFVGRGLLARILYTVPRNRVGYRKVNATPVPDEVVNTYGDRVRTLVPQMHDWGAMPLVLQLSPGAAELFLAAERNLEPRLAGDLRPVVEWASKAMGAAARVAGLLHLASYDSVNEAFRRPIAAETMQAALVILDYFTAHALVVFGLMGADHTAAAAQDVLAYVHGHDLTEVSVRDLFTNLARSRFPRTEDLELALAVLVAAGWAAPVAVPRKPGPGRPPSPRYRFRPPQNPHNPQNPKQAADLHEDQGGNGR